MVNPKATAEQSSQKEAQKVPKTRKQAVIVIHGMGEQRPMETIREFVSNVWKQDPNIEAPHYWNKPSSISGSFEQRRLTTDTPAVKGSKNSKVQRTDFYEYYWAHATVNTKWEHFTGWFKTLLACYPSKYNDHPDTLQLLWYRLWSVLIIAFLSVVLWAIAVYLITSKTDGTLAFLLNALITIAEALALLGLNKLKNFFTNYFGDVARYVRAQPANINIRQTIRQGGIEFIERIHKSNDYDRIVLVGHSLGSIIAYDILNHLWARHNKFPYTKSSKSHTSPLSKEALGLLEQLQALAQKVGSKDFQQDEYRELQQQLFSDLRANDKSNNWLISDFITLGSPLTYADILLFDNKEQFIKRKLDREYPMSPPMLDNDKWFYNIGNRKYLHHGAVFAPVRWTNIFMTHHSFIKGDLISGPVSRNFSYTNLNVEKLEIAEPDNILHTPINEIEIDYSKVKDGFTHTEYWKQQQSSQNEHLAQLRASLHLY